MREELGLITVLNRYTSSNYGNSSYQSHVTTPFRTDRNLILSYHLFIRYLSRLLKEIRDVCLISLLFLLSLYLNSIDTPFPPSPKKNFCTSFIIEQTYYYPLNIPVPLNCTLCFFSEKSLTSYSSVFPTIDLLNSLLTEIHPRTFK